MSQSAHVNSLDAVQAWRESYCAFRAQGQEALTSIAMEIRRAFDWLDTQYKFWQQEVRRRDEQLVQARNELWRKKMLPVLGREPDCTFEEKAFRKAQDRLREAEEKVQITRRWVPALQRAIEEYDTQGRRLSSMFDGEVPRALALLEQKLASLEAYLAMAPSLPAPASATAPEQSPPTPAPGTERSES